MYLAVNLDLDKTRRVDRLKQTHKLIHWLYFSCMEHLCKNCNVIAFGKKESPVRLYFVGCGC